MKRVIGVFVLAVLVLNMAGVYAALQQPTTVSTPAETIPTTPAPETCTDKCNKIEENILDSNKLGECVRACEEPPATLLLCGSCEGTTPHVQTTTGTSCPIAGTGMKPFKTLSHDELEAADYRHKANFDAWVSTQFSCGMNSYFYTESNIGEYNDNGIFDKGDMFKAISKTADSKVNILGKELISPKGILLDYYGSGLAGETTKPRFDAVNLNPGEARVQYGKNDYVLKGHDKISFDENGNLVKIEVNDLIFPPNWFGYVYDVTKKEGFWNALKKVDWETVAIGTYQKDNGDLIVGLGDSIYGNAEQKTAIEAARKKEETGTTTTTSELTEEQKAAADAAAKALEDKRKSCWDQCSTLEGLAGHSDCVTNCMR